VQFLQADLRLRQRKPAGRDHRGPVAQAGTALPEAVLKKDPRIAVVELPGRATAGHARTNAGNAAAGARASSRDAAVRGVERLALAPYADDLASVAVSHVHAYRQRGRPGDRRQNLRRYVEIKGWKFELIDVSDTGLGGIKKWSFR